MTNKVSLYTKRVGGIEPPSLAWKARVLPLNYTRIGYCFILAYIDYHGFAQRVYAAGLGGVFSTAL